jgi:cytoskeletal protein RodZ
LEADLANDSNHESYSKNDSSKRRAAKVLGLGLVSAASAVAGGLAVAWWYRKTLTKLQNPIVTAEFPKSESVETEDKILSPLDADAYRSKS